MNFKFIHVLYIMILYEIIDNYYEENRNNDGPENIPNIIREIINIFLAHHTCQVNTKIFETFQFKKKINEF